MNHKLSLTLSCVERMAPLCCVKKSLTLYQHRLSSSEPIAFRRLQIQARRPKPEKWQQQIRLKHQISRKLVGLHDPLKVKRKEEPKPMVETHSASATAFNLVMGEIVVGNSFKRIAVEGGRLVEDGIIAGLQLEKLFLRRNIKVLPPGLTHLLEEEQEQIKSGVRASRSPEIHRIGETLIKTWSDLTTPPGVIGIFKKPQVTDAKVNVKRESIIPVTLICDNIREPGNLGSILRSATGVGCDQVYLTKGCVDPWNMKVLRGACGAHFRVPITTDVTEQNLERIMNNKVLEISANCTDEKKPQIAMLICDSNTHDKRIPFDSLSFREIDYSKYSHLFLILGGETEGISSTTVALTKLLNGMKSLDLCRVRIPLANGMESLNAANAFGIIVFEISRYFSNNSSNSSNS